jgi:hypothetical protein
MMADKDLQICYLVPDYFDSANNRFSSVLIGWETAPYVGLVPREARSNQHAPRRIACP